MQRVGTVLHLIHGDRVTQIGVSKLAIISSDNARRLIDIKHQWNVNQNAAVRVEEN